MRLVWLVVLIVVLGAVPGAAQSFEGTHLDPFTVPYCSPPFHYEASRYLFASFTTTADVIGALVPEPLDDMMGTEIWVMVIEHHIVHPFQLDYHEVVLSIPVTYQSVPGEYEAVLYLNVTDAIVPGREIWGTSKIDAEIDVVWSPSGDAVTAIISRSGTALIEINASFGPIDAGPPSDGVVYSYNLKLIPSAESGSDPDVCQLTRLPLNYSLSGHRSGTGTLTFGFLQSDPLSTIPVIGSVAMETYYLDLDLPFGDVVWDYLAQPGGCAPVLSSPFLNYDYSDSREASD